LDLPGVAPRDLPARQRTLAETVAWSYGLLDAPARRLLERLSVFAGGFRLAEVEAVAGPADELGAVAIDALAALVEQSLVDSIPGPDVPRYRLLETIQWFARERLDASGDAAVTGERHARAYLALAEQAASHMPGRHQVPWLDRLTIDHDNIRAAFAWAIEHNDAEVAHRLLAASWRFWQFRGHVTEGRARAVSVLAMPGGDVRTAWRMRGLEAAGGLDWWAGDIATADAHYEQALALARAIDDPRGIADALYNLIHTKFQVDPTRIDAMRAEARGLYRDVDDPLALARLEWTRSWQLAFGGQPDEARRITERALGEFETADDDFYLALAAASLGGLAMMERDIPTAVRYGLRSVAANRAIGDLASITLFLRSAASLFMITGHSEAAATVLGAFEGHCRRYGIKPPLDPDQFLGLGGPADDLLAAMIEPELQAAHAHGEAMTTDAVLEYLFEQAARLTPEPPRP
jgi:tetratricopeptide (TPR) repeat protein